MSSSFVIVANATDSIYREVGFARSLLVYKLPDGRLKLIDGHPRRDIDPDMEVEVEVLDVNDEEARALLLSIDRLAQLARTQDQLHRRLLEITPTTARQLPTAVCIPPSAFCHVPSAHCLLPTAFCLGPVTGRSEPHQVELLERFRGEELGCKALVS